MRELDLHPHQRDILRKLVAAAQDSKVFDFCFIPLYERPERITLNTTPPTEISCSVGDLKALERQGLVTLFQDVRADITVIEGTVNASAVHAVDNSFRIRTPAEGHLVSNIYQGEVTMGNKYQANQVAAMGPNARANNVTIQQIRMDLKDSVDLHALANELALLRGALRQRASEPDHDIAVGELAAAEKAARDGDGGRVLECLKRAGTWAFNAATDIGTNLAATVIQRAMGIGP